MGWTALAVAGLVASVTVFTMAMVGTSLCICDAMMALMVASWVILVGSVTPMTRMMVGAPGAGTFSRLRWMLGGWQLAVMGGVIVGVAVSLAHYGPVFRALPMDANVPDRVMAGVIGVLPIPVYLFAVMTLAKGLRRLRPVSEAVGVPTAA